MKKLQNTRPPALIVFLTVAAGGYVSAQERQPVRIDSAVVSAYGLHESSISAFGSELPSPLLKSPSATTEQILRMTPAIDIRERGGMSVQADIGIRGGSPDQTVLLLNGVDFTDIRTGHQTHSLPVDADIMSGIRLIDGGDMGLSGAIDMSTRPAASQYLRANVSGGSYGYLYANVSGAATVGQAGRLQIFEAASLRRSDGYRHNTDFSNTNLYTNVRYTHPSAGSFEMQAGRQDRAFGANGFYSLKYPDQYESTGTTLASLRWRGAYGSWSMESYISFRYNSDRFELVRGSEDKVPFNYHLTDTYGAYAAVSRSWRAGRTGISGHYQYGDITSTVLGKELVRPVRIDGTDGRYYTKGDSRRRADIRLRHHKRWEHLAISASVAGDFSSYGFTPLWDMAIDWIPNTRTRINLMTARTMRLPTFTDLYYTAAGYIGNPSLEPENASTIKAALRRNGGHWQFDADVYCRRGENTIDWVRENAATDWECRQITVMNTVGADISATWHAGQGILDSMTLLGGWIDCDKSSDGLISKYALDYMRLKCSLLADFRIGRRAGLHAGLSYYDRNGNYSDMDGRLTGYSPYTIMNARLSYDIGIASLYINADNVTSAEYFDYGGLKMPGIWIIGGIVVTL